MTQSQPGAAARGLATDIYLLEARARRRLDGTVPTQTAHSKATLVTRSELIPGIEMSASGVCGGAWGSRRVHPVGARTLRMKRALNEMPVFRGVTRPTRKRLPSSGYLIMSLICYRPAGLPL